MANTSKQTEVYKCSVCGRKTRVDVNQRGLSVILHCTITARCVGKLNKVTNTTEINSTPTITPELSGVQDWFQRKILYNHTQIVPSFKWFIKHNLSNNPIFDVHIYNDSDTMVKGYPKITAIDQNNTVLTFEKQVSGVAQAISLSSQNTYIQEKIEPTAERVQISTNNGLITIATLDSARTVSLTTKWSVVGPNPPIQLDYVDISKTVSTLSPWSDGNKIYLDGLVYTIRSVDLLSDPNTSQYFTRGDIPLGSSVIMSNPQNTDVLILLARDPCTINDKVYDQFINIKSLTNINDQFLTYERGKLYADQTIIKSIYPHIKVV